MFKFDQIKHQRAQISGITLIGQCVEQLNMPRVPRSDGRHPCSAAPVPPESGAQDQRLWTGPSSRGTLPEAAERGGHAQVSRV